MGGLLALGCAADTTMDALPPEAPEPRLGERSDEIVGGTITSARPEVGYISGCTATLVAPDVIITAAHCLGYRSATRRGSYGRFTILPASGGQRSFPIVRYRSYSRQLGRDDVALMQLGEPVPDALATPAGLADAEPPSGAGLTIFGFGCTTRGRRSDWRKRAFDFRQGERTSNLCPGDSGGPVMTEDGRVLRINSGYYLDRYGTDIYGMVPPNFGRLEAQVREWSAFDRTDPPPTPDPEPDPEPEPEPLPEDPCAAQPSCAPCAATSGCGWCGATDTCVSVDGHGRAASCAGDVALDTPQCRYDSCGIYEGFTDYTCRRTHTSFVRCRPGGTPEFLFCPSGYTCRPGSRYLMCYR